MNHAGRLARLRERMEREGAEALLVSHLPNIRYLCGFSGSNGLLLVEPGGATLFTDGRYRAQAAEEVRAARVAIPARGDLWGAAGGRAGGRAWLALEAEHLSVAQQARLRAAWGGSGRRLRLGRGWVEAQRAVKDAAEIAALGRAIRLASSVFDEAVGALHPGVAETAVAGALEHALRRAGGEGLAFDTIVASGPRSALIHGHPTAAQLPRAGFVVIDYGVILAGYRSDMTRTPHVGRPSRRARAIYELVLEAQQAAIAAIGPGVAASAVDAAARRPIRKAGYGRCFAHSTGHGVGLEIHEGPRLEATSTDRLEAGQVVTVEPGVYLPGWGGVRIEDIVLVTATGAELLTPTPKAMLIVA